VTHRTPIIFTAGAGFRNCSQSIQHLDCTFKS